MDLKQNQKSVLEAIESGAASLEKIAELSGYKERTIKSALKKLQELKLVDSLQGEDGEKIYFSTQEQDAPTQTEQPTQERLPHLRKLDFLKVQENDKFNFRNKVFVVLEIIQQKAIAGKPFLKMIAKSDEDEVEITVNISRGTAPISLKEF